MFKILWNQKSKPIVFRILIYGIFFQIIILMFLLRSRSSGNQEEAQLILNVSISPRAMENDKTRRIYDTTLDANSLRSEEDVVDV